MKNIVVLLALVIVLGVSAPLSAQEGKGGYLPEKDPFDPSSRRGREGKSFGGHDNEHGGDHAHPYDREAERVVAENIMKAHAAKVAADAKAVLDCRVVCEAAPPSVIEALARDVVTGVSRRFRNVPPSSDLEMSP